MVKSWTVLRKLSRAPAWTKLMSRFLEDHPGGAKAILLYAGREATEEFEMVHPANTLEKHAKHIGTSHLLSPFFYGSILISSHW
jgi:hypothetical protein